MACVCRELWETGLGEIWESFGCQVGSDLPGSAVLAVQWGHPCLHTTGAPPVEAKGPSTLQDVSLQVLRDNIPLGTTKAEWPRCQRHLSSPGCPWNSVRSPGLASTLMDHLPVTGHHVPPLETQARLSMSTNELPQKLPSSCRSPLPRVPARTLTRGFASSGSILAHVSVYLPMARAFCMSQLVAGKHCGRERNSNSM